MLLYFPCCNLTPKLKQYEKMRIKTQCPTYTHLAIRPGSFCWTQGTGLDRSHAGMDPGSPGRSHKTLSSLLWLHSLQVALLISGWAGDLSGFVFLIEKIRQNFFFFVCLVWQTKIFKAWTLLGNYIRNISIYLQQMDIIKLVGLYVPGDLPL